MARIHALTEFGEKFDVGSGKSGFRGLFAGGDRRGAVYWVALSGGLGPDPCTVTRRAQLGLGVRCSTVGVGRRPSVWGGAGAVGMTERALRFIWVRRAVGASRRVAIGVWGAADPGG